MGRGRRREQGRALVTHSRNPCTPAHPTHRVGCEDDLTLSGEGLICGYTGQEGGGEMEKDSFTLSPSPIFYIPPQTKLDKIVKFNVTSIYKLCHLPSPPFTEHQSLLVSKGWGCEGQRGVRRGRTHSRSPHPGSSRCRGCRGRYSWIQGTRGRGRGWGWKGCRTFHCRQWSG